MGYKQHNSPFNSYRNPKRIASNYDIKKLRSMPTFGEGISDETALGGKDVEKEVKPSGTNAENKGDNAATDALAKIDNIDKSAQGDNLDNRIKNASPRQKVRLENKKDRQDHRDQRIENIGELKNNRKALARDTREEARTDRGINRQDKILKRQINRGVITEEQAKGLKKDQGNNMSVDESGITTRGTTFPTPEERTSTKDANEAEKLESDKIYRNNQLQSQIQNDPDLQGEDEAPIKFNPKNKINSRGGKGLIGKNMETTPRNLISKGKGFNIDQSTIDTFNDDIYESQYPSNSTKLTKGGFRGFMNAPMNMKKQDNMKQITRRGSALPMLGPDETAAPNVNRAGGVPKTLAPNPTPPQPPNQVSAQVQQQANMMTGIAQDPGVLNTDENNAAQIAQAQQTLGQPTNTIGDGVGTTNTEPTFGGAPAKKQDPPKETSAKTDATTNVIPGAGQYNKESVSFDYEMEPYRGHQGTYSQKRDANEHKRKEFYKHMDSAKGKSAASGFPITDGNGPSSKKGDWIQKGIDSGGIKKGGLHETLGIPKGQKIPHEDKVKASESSNPKERKQGELALTFAKMNKK